MERLAVVTLFGCLTLFFIFKALESLLEEKCPKCGAQMTDYDDKRSTCPNCKSF